MTKLASTESVEILACMKNVESMQFARPETTELTVFAHQTTKEAPMKSAVLMNALLMMIVLITWHVERKSAEILVTALRMPFVTPEITGDTAPAYQDTQEIRMVLPVSKVSSKNIISSCISTFKKCTFFVL